MKNILIIATLLCLYNITFSQHGIGTNTPNANAVLHLASVDSTKGFIIPTVTTAKRPVASTALNGMLVYNITDSCVQLCDGAKWECVGQNDTSQWVDGSEVGLTPGAIYARKALANGDTIIINNNGNYGIGTNNPVSQFHMNKATNNQFNALTIGADHALANFEVGEIAFRRSFYNPTESAATMTFYRNSDANGGGLRFKTQNNPSNLDTVMDITPGGRVGIGTTTPNAKLDIEASYRNQLVIGKQGESGGILLRRNDGNANAYIGYADSINTLTFSEGSGGGDILFRQNVAGFGSDTTVFLEGSNGNVGIGTTTPNSKLTIDAGNSPYPVRVLGNSFRHLQTFSNSITTGTDNVTGTSYQNNDGTTLSTVGQILYSDNTFNNPFWRKNSLAIAATRSNGTINFFTGAGTSSGIPKMLIDSNGFTGLNITSPTHRLDVNGETRVRTINDVTTTNNILVSSATGVLQKIHIDSIKGESDADFFKVGTTSAPTNINDSIYTMGNVGIGTNNPVQALDINGILRVSQGTNGTIRLVDNLPGIRTWMDKGIIATSSSDQMYVGLKTEGGNREDAVIAWGDDFQDDLRFINVRSGGTINGDERMRILGSNGNVGIGTTTPQEELEVNGEIEIAGGEAANDTRLIFAASDKSNRFQIETDLSTNTPEDLLGFRGLANDDILVLKGDGKVGVGVTVPQKRLHVNANNDSLQFDNLSGTGNILNIDANGKVFRGSADATISSIKTVTTNSTALNGDATILVDATGGDRTITLPSVASLPVGKKYIIKKIDGSTNNVIIDPIGAETIDGTATQSTSNPFDAIVIQSNGTEWFVIN